MSFKYEETCAKGMLNDLQLFYTAFTEAFSKFKSEVVYIIRSGTFSSEKMWEFHDAYIPIEEKCDSFVEFFRRNMPHMTDKETGWYECLREMYETFRLKVVEEMFIIMTNVMNPTRMLKLLKN
jgi:hypothetical protein